MGVTVGTRILLVEDDADNQDTLAMLLSVWGYDVLIADTGESAIEFAAKCPPDIVVLDLGLPGLQGEEAAAILKRMPSPPFVVAYTGYDRRQVAALEAGCDAVLLKPSIDKLAALLASAKLARVAGTGS